jgi:hypothetical protein
MKKFKPRYISIVYPPGTSIGIFVIFGFSVLFKELDDGSLDTLIEEDETELSQYYFSLLLKALQQDELYVQTEKDFQKHPELESIIIQNANAYT